MLNRGQDRAVYFSGNFWYARDYARNSGGETVHNATLLVAELLENTVRDCLASDDLSELVAIQTELRELTVDTIAMVFAVRVDAKWLRHPGSLARDELGVVVVPDVNIACLRSVPIDRIVGKVEYISGLNPGYLGPHPASWIDARSLGCDK